MCVQIMCDRQNKSLHTHSGTGRSVYKCAGGILETLTRRGSIRLQVIENDIIKLLLTRQTNPQLCRLRIDNRFLQKAKQRPPGLPSISNHNLGESNREMFRLGRKKRGSENGERKMTQIKQSLSPRLKTVQQLWFGKQYRSISRSRPTI